METDVARQPKRIRFVATYDGASRSKNQRTAAACYTCRKRKTRCDGKRPVCKTCNDYGHTCLGYSNSRRGQASSDRVKSAKQQSPMSPPQASRASITLNEDFAGIVMGEQEQEQEREKEQDASIYSKMYHGNTKSNASEGRRYSTDETATKLAQPKTSAPNQSLKQRRRSLSLRYFRYFGPSAIVPGFKQTVVRLKEHRHSPDISLPISGGSATKSVSGKPPLDSETTDCLSAIQSSVYDPVDSEPINPLIEHLVDTFFTRLGCTFPFLRRDRFMPMLREKKVDAVLVHAICAVAARFSTHPVLTTASYSYSCATSDSDDPDTLKHHKKSDYGQVFAQRAKSAVVDSFPCPTLASIQACLLLAYVSFGSNQDSALWLFLGCAIRMVQDLGLQKLECVIYPGQQHLNLDLNNDDDNVDDYGYTGSMSVLPCQTEQSAAGLGELGLKLMDIPSNSASHRDENINTFWAVLMLDRIISSGTGRPVMLRDEDIDLPFPPYSFNPESAWPLPFPVLSRILHLYGRVTDLLNTVQDIKDITQDMRKRLDWMENDLTSVYEGLDQRLTFNVLNFQHYVEEKQGANFVMVHFWFHILIIILHQPTLLQQSYYRGGRGGGGSLQDMFPNSRELSMSSAKTIADILAFVELIDEKILIGNPFTSQPIYVAACAFLMEMATLTGASRPNSAKTSSTPLCQPCVIGEDQRPPAMNISSSGLKSDNPRFQKNSLLATAAKQNYQRCYKALQKLETYWDGIKYILTALDQKAEGVWDPEIYTAEEMEVAKQEKIKTGSVVSNSLYMRAQSLYGRSGTLTADKGMIMEAETETETEQDLRAPDLQALDAGQMWTLNGNINSPNGIFTMPNPNKEYLQRQPSIIDIDACSNPRVVSESPTQSTDLSVPMSEPEVDQTDLLASMSIENYHGTSDSGSGGYSLYDFSLEICSQDVHPALSDPIDCRYTGIVSDMMIDSQHIDPDVNLFPF